jgi:peptide/nickel transport system permease protein
LTLRSFLLKRFLYTIVLVFFTIVLNWLIFEAMPGLSGQLYNVLGNRSSLTDPDKLKKQLALYGLDKPVWEQFFDYVKAMLTFNFGYSYHDAQPISSAVITSGRLVNTLELIGTSTVLSIVIGILLGILVSSKRGSTADNFFVSASLTTFSLPTFFMGTMLIFIFADVLNWFPASGTAPYTFTNPSTAPVWWLQIPGRLQFLFLPALTLTLFTYGGFLLLTRATMIETLNEDYITTARAKGLSGRAILTRHAFKNASLPLVTATALQFGGILGGAIITESLFNWAGLGRWLFDSVVYKDFPVMQAMFYLIALCVIGANFVSDVIYGIIDPRIRYE